jgi:DNA-directed RNA polymerase subunit RPC12/RpoP
MNTNKIDWTNVKEAEKLNRILTKKQKFMFKERCKNGHIGQPIYKCPDCGKTFCNACSDSWETDKEAFICCPHCGKTTTI